MKYSDLSPKQKKLGLKRWHAKRDAKPDPLDRVVAPGLTLRQLRENTNTATSLRYGEPQAQLQRQAPRIANWYQAYANRIAQAKAQAQQDYGNAVAGVQALQGGLDQASQNVWAGQQQASAADAANRGATMNPQLAAQAHNASNVRNALTGSFGAMLLSQGVNQGDLLRQRGLGARQQGIEQLNVNKQKLLDLLKEKGAFRSQYRDQAISDASKNALNNALTQATLGVKAADIKNTTAKTQGTKADTARTKAETAFLNKYGYLPGKQPSALDQAKLDYFNKNGYFPPTGPPKDTKGNGKDQYGNTVKEQRAAQDSWNEAWHMAGVLKRNGITSEQEMYDFLVQKRNINDTYARAAAHAAFHGGRLGKLRKNLERRGVTKFPKQKAAPTGAATYGGPT